MLQGKVHWAVSPAHIATVVAKRKAIESLTASQSTNVISNLSPLPHVSTNVAQGKVIE